MALTITENFREHWGRRRVVFVAVSFDSSYPTGGESLTAANLGLGRIDEVFVTGNTAGYQFDYDKTNSKLIARYGDNNNASDAPAVEVPDTTNLSSVTNVRLMVVGA